MQLPGKAVQHLLPFTSAHALPYYSNENVVLANLLIDDVLRVPTHSRRNTSVLSPK